MAASISTSTPVDSYDAEGIVVGVERGESGATGAGGGDQVRVRGFDADGGARVGDEATVPRPEADELLLVGLDVGEVEGRPILGEADGAEEEGSLAFEGLVEVVVQAGAEAEVEGGAENGEGGGQEERVPGGEAPPALEAGGRGAVRRRGGGGGHGSGPRR